MPSSTSPAPLLSPAWKQNLRRRLLAWYGKHARTLPWRSKPTPYRVWVSEVMLQQTQVETVRGYFSRFMKRFPTIEKLATAEEQEVLRLWEGLGYYRRARSLHAAARQIVAEHGGRLPSDLAGLQRLPGIGRYTAGAIRSIAFGEPAPVLEANTTRLLLRLVGYREPASRGPTQKLLWTVAEDILPRTRVSDFNQALMELGALVCTPAGPACAECPLMGLCVAFREGLQGEIPAAERKMQFEEVREAAVLVRKGRAVLLRQCGEGERWAGLWDFPRFPLESEGPLFAQKELAEKTCEQTGIRVTPGGLLKTLKHGVTKYRITLDCYEGRYAGGRVRGGARWVPVAELGGYPLSSTGRKLAALV